MSTLDELEQLSKDNVTTPWPWVVDPVYPQQIWKQNDSNTLNHRICIADSSKDFFPGQISCIANIRLIAAMRNNIDALLAVARAAEKFLHNCEAYDELRAALGELK